MYLGSGRPIDPSLFVKGFSSVLAAALREAVDDEHWELRAAGSARDALEHDPPGRGCGPHGASSVAADELAMATTAVRRAAPAPPRFVRSTAPQPTGRNENSRRTAKLALEH